MNQPTGKHYMLSALRRKHTDRVPTTVLIGPYCSRLTQYSLREILTDARKSAEAHLAFHDRFKPDSLVVYNDIYLEAEAVGCELEFPEDRISHPKRAMLDDKTQLARLKVPDPQRTDAYRILSKFASGYRLRCGKRLQWALDIRALGILPCISGGLKPC